MYFSRTNDKNEITIPPNYNGNAFANEENEGKEDNKNAISDEKESFFNSDKGLLSSLFSSASREDMLLLVVLFLLYKEEADEDIILILLVLLFVK